MTLPTALGVVQQSCCVLFCNEKAVNVSCQMSCATFHAKSFAAIPFDLSYRGYGLSKGQPNERGLKLDAQAALDHILARTDFKQPRVLVFGRSLGGAVAIHLAANNQDKVRALMLSSTGLGFERCWLGITTLAVWNGGLSQ